MIFEVASYRASLLGVDGHRVLNLRLETRVTKGFVCADNEALVAKKIGLIHFSDVTGCEDSLRESFARHYFPRGVAAAQVMLELLTQGHWPNQSGTTLVYVISQIVELAEGQLAKVG